MCEHPSQVLNFFIIILCDYVLKLLKEDQIITRKVSFVEDLLQKLRIHGLFFGHFPTSSKKYLRNLLLHLEKEYFYYFSLLMRCLFLGISKINLKAFRIQYFINSYFVFFIFVNFSIKVFTMERFWYFGNFFVKLALNSFCGEFEYSTRKPMIDLNKGINTQVDLSLVIHCYWSIKNEACPPLMI